MRAATTTTSTRVGVSASARAPRGGAGAAYAELVKLRLSAMVVASSGAGYLLAGPPWSVAQLGGVALGTALAAASASTCNQIYERHTDGMMRRTASRPLPAGVVSLEAARRTAVGLGVGSVAVLGATTNPVTTVLGLVNIGLYAGVYTPMKQRSIYNTWVGAVVGAIPPIMGYAAATGTALAAPPLLLGAGLFFWQFPHFFALSWLLRRDYARGGHRMLVCSDVTGKATADVMMRHALANTALPFVAYGLDVTTIMFPIESVAYNAAMLWACRKFQREARDENARRVFRLSLVYLPLFMASFVFHAKEDRRHTVEDSRVVVWADETTFLDRARAWAREYCPHEWTVLRNRLGVDMDTSQPPRRLLPNDHEGVCPSTTLRTSLDVLSSAVGGVRTSPPASAAR